MIRAGFIGLGNISTVHLDVLKDIEDVKITAVCDCIPEYVKDKQIRYGGNGYLDFKEMLEKEKLDAVWLCTPSDVREEPLVACAEIGLPVFCEKPAEHSVVLALRIADQLDQLNAKVQVGYVFRTNQVVRALKKRLKGDNIHLVQSFYGCGASLSMCLPAWFYNKDISGGALVDQATHNLDLLRNLFGEVEEIRGFVHNPVKKKKIGYTIDEVISLSLRFENGLLASHIHTWVGDDWRNEIVFCGEKALYRLAPGGKLTIEQQSNDPLKADPQKHKDNVVKQVGSMYLDEDTVFLEMLKSDDWSNNPSTYRDSVKTLQLTLACDQAVTSGRSIKLRELQYHS